MPDFLKLACNTYDCLLQSQVLQECRKEPRWRNKFKVTCFGSLNADGLEQPVTQFALKAADQRMD
jgi:hypothetical protein